MDIFQFREIKELISQKEGKIKSEILNMEEVHWTILSLWEKNMKIYISNYVNLPNAEYIGICWKITYVIRSCA